MYEVATQPVLEKRTRMIHKRNRLGFLWGLALVLALLFGQAAAQDESPIRVVKKPKIREPNYSEYERPAVQRKHAVGDDVTASDESMQELLDVPAFLRRQAD